MTAELRLLLRLLRDPAFAASLELAEWDAVLRLARRGNLMGRLAVGLATVSDGLTLPTEVMSHLASARALAKHQRQAIVWEVRHIGNALASMGISVILLKGAAYAMANLTAAEGRLFGDVDILVPAESINRVEAALMLHGWSGGHVDPYDNRYYRQWMHEIPPMAHRKRGTVVDVHHTILPLTSKTQPPVALLRKDAIALSDVPFHVLSPCDMVIHSATHLFHEGELNNGLRDLFDLQALLIEFARRDPGFWDQLPDRAEQLGLQWPLRLAFRYLRHYLDTEIPESAMSGIRQAPLQDKLLDLIYIPGFPPDHPLSSSPGAGVARAMLYLRGHMLRMPLRLLLPHLGRKAMLRLYKTSSRSN